jgi:hypothetical protein
LAFNPLADALKRQASSDHAAALLLDAKNSKFPDWIVTISFYMALHMVNAHAAQAGWKWQKFRKNDPHKISRHSQTLRYVSITFGRIIFRKYNRLYSECWSARYDPFYLRNTNPSDAAELFKVAEELMQIMS